MAAVIALLLRYVLSTLSALPVDRLQGRRSSECHGKDVAVVFSTLPLLSLWPPLLFASMAGSGGRNRLKRSIRPLVGDRIETWDPGWRSVFDRLTGQQTNVRAVEVGELDKSAVVVGIE